MHQPPPLKPSYEKVNIPPPERIESQRIRLDHFRNPWSRDLTGNALLLQRPERASQCEQRLRTAQGRLGRSEIPIFTKQPPSRSPPPDVVKLADFVPPSTRIVFIILIVPGQLVLGSALSRLLDIRNPKRATSFRNYRTVRCEAKWVIATFNRQRSLQLKRSRKLL